jgi:hypothetical protein
MAVSFLLAVRNGAGAFCYRPRTLAETVLYGKQIRLCSAAK